jgi:hypothetical protein
MTPEELRLHSALMAAMAMATASGVAFVPSAVVDKAMVHDMLCVLRPLLPISLLLLMSERGDVRQVRGLPAVLHVSRQLRRFGSRGRGGGALPSVRRLLPRVRAAVQVPAQGVVIRSPVCCFSRSRWTLAQLQLAFDGELVDAMLFDEAARALLGVPATQLKRALLPRHPALPLVLAGILEGLHVAFHFQRRPQPRDAKYTVRLCSSVRHDYSIHEAAYLTAPLSSRRTSRSCALHR